VKSGLYSTSDPKFAAHLIRDGILRPSGCCRTADQTTFSFEDPHGSGPALFERFVKGEKPERVIRAGMVLPDGFIETLSDGHLLVSRNGTEERRDTWPLKRGKIFVPPSDVMIRERVVLLPDGPQPYGTQEQLFREISRCVHRYVDIPEAWEELVAHYVLLSWVFDAFRSLPYLRFLGSYGTGKTRMLEVARELCYRAIEINGASSTASIFRTLHEWRGTLAFDETDFQNSAEYAEIIKILNSGYKADSPVLRCEGKNFTPQPFHVFGPKILSNRTRFKDEALESRCLTFETSCKKTREDVPLELPSAFFQESRGLRNKLLQWRFDTFRKLVPEDTRINGIELRLSQILSPLYLIASTESFRGRLLEFSKEYGSQQRQRRPEVIVLEAIGGILAARFPKDRNKPIPLKGIAEHTDLVMSEMGLARDNDHKELLTPKEVSVLIKGMGLEIKRYGRGRVLIVDEAALAANRREFGLDGNREHEDEQAKEGE